MSRFILYRVGEMFNANIILHPKPFDDKSGSGAHVNCSTLDMRNEASKYASNRDNNLI